MDYAAVIAAAGLSSRMGEFKPLLPLGGESMIKSVIRKLREAGAEEIVVVAGYQAELLRQHLAHSGVQICLNPDYADTQMFDSISLGLKALSRPYERVFLTPGDVPLVRTETILRLKQMAADMVRPVYNGAPGHPVLLSAACVPDILAHGVKVGLKKAMDALAAAGWSLQELAVNDEAVTMDADTPEDFQRLQRRAAEEALAGREK